MPLDPDSGELRFDDMSLVVGPGLRRSELDAHADASRFAPVSSDPPHAMLRASSRLDGVLFVVVLWFEGEQLRSVRLAAGDTAIAGTSWDDHDPERLRRFHDGWLERQLGPGSPTHAGAFPYGGTEYRFRWGTIGSYLHPQDGNGNITLGYE